MLQGILVDLVPYGQRYLSREHGWLNGEGVYWWATGDRWLVTHQELRAWHQEWAQERHERGDPTVTFGIQTKDGTPIGLFRLKLPAPVHRWTLLSALIGDEQSWGGGYGSDALLLGLAYGFDWLDLHKAWLMTMSPNARVIRQMAKVGFAFEGRQRQAAYVDGAWHDMLHYSLLRAEWPGYEAMVQRLGLRAREEG